jgi:hypothetical protein
MPPQPPASVELACKAMTPCMPCLANALVAAGCTTGTTSSLPLCSMPPGKRVCPAQVSLSMLTLLVVMTKQDIAGGDPLPWARPDGSGHCGYPLLQAHRSSPSCPHSPKCSSSRSPQEKMQRIPAVLPAGAHVFRFRPGELWLPCHTSYGLHLGHASTGAVSYESFVTSVHRGISKALVEGNHGDMLHEKFVHAWPPKSAAMKASQSASIRAPAVQ